MANTDDAEQQSDQTACAECGAAIDRDEWHPVRAVTEDDDFRIYAFCGERCRESWTGPQR